MGFLYLQWERSWETWTVNSHLEKQIKRNYCNCLFIKYQGFKIISYFRQTWATILSFWVWSHCRWPCDDWHLFCSKGWPQETTSCTFSFSVHFCLYVVILFRKKQPEKVIMNLHPNHILFHFRALFKICWFSSMPSVDPPRIKIYVERTILFTDCDLNKHNPAFNWLQIRCICGCEYTRAMKSYNEILFSPVLREITGRRMA